MKNLKICLKRLPSSEYASKYRISTSAARKSIIHLFREIVSTMILSKALLKLAGLSLDVFHVLSAIIMSETMYRPCHQKREITIITPVVSRNKYDHKRPGRKRNVLSQQQQTQGPVCSCLQVRLSVKMASNFCLQSRE